MLETLISQMSKTDMVLACFELRKIQNLPERGEDMISSKNSMYINII